MSGVTVMTPDPIVEKLLLLLTADLSESGVLLDAAWMQRMAEFGCHTTGCSGSGCGMIIMCGLRLRFLHICCKII